MTTDLKAALEAYKPNLIEGYSNMVRRSFARMVEAHGECLKGIYNSRDFARMWSSTVSRCTKHLSAGPTARVTDPIVICEERLARAAGEYADAVVQSWEAKITGKMGELEGASVKRLDGGTFFISGMKNGKKVCIEQTTVLKCSSKGLLFNQFPARIYVEGKFTSEAAYKKLAA